MAEVFADLKLMNKAGQLVDSREALSNKIVGIYFSAEWCPPCRGFTPVLSDFYTELVKESDSPAPFEIVFVSSDRSEKDMMEYFQKKHGDWLVLPFNPERKRIISQRYNISGIPTLVIVKGNGDVITRDGRADVQTKGPACFKSWQSA
ncbi:nucleoredoxin-like protein 2 [Oryzias melastigma]|uniref:Nucleoredoxin like 2 n=1 Tax=Oryzias melastigma TaxID=30732 RepID=A0A3B3BPZ0_ORYME|nr:nucleoredoxin-like protein 2 [Oryzias melastigma]